MVREAAIPALPLDGRLASKVIREQVKDRISAITDKAEGRVPGLGIVMANGFVSLFARFVELALISCYTEDTMRAVSCRRL